MLARFSVATKRFVSSRLRKATRLRSSPKSYVAATPAPGRAKAERRRCRARSPFTVHRSPFAVHLSPFTFRRARFGGGGFEVRSSGAYQQPDANACLQISAF